MNRFLLHPTPAEPLGSIGEGTVLLGSSPRHGFVNASGKLTSRLIGQRLAALSRVATDVQAAAPVAFSERTGEPGCPRHRASSAPAVTPQCRVRG